MTIYRVSRLTSFMSLILAAYFSMFLFSGMTGAISAKDIVERPTQGDRILTLEERQRVMHDEQVAMKADLKLAISKLEKIEGAGSAIAGVIAIFQLFNLIAARRGGAGK